MSARYVPVGWNRTKLVYDGVLAVAVLGYLAVFLGAGPRGGAEPLDGPSQAMRAYGSCAFLLLSLILAIGPLARLDRRFLPLLYNRRHFGVACCLVALAHAAEVLGWYFAFSDVSPGRALLFADWRFVPFGLGALLVLVLLAATSHDFWLAFLGPALWKVLHMLVYAGYVLAVLHIGFGALRAATDPALGVLVVGSALGLVTLHLLAARQAAREDARLAQPWREAPWLIAGPAAAIAEGQGITLQVPGAEPVAIFRHQGRLSAVTNLCAHQNGPLGEGRVVDGCITCPWHGFQYRLEDGCAPPPYTEKLATYRLVLAEGLVLLDPRPNPPGTRVEPLVVP